jgi:hypothetical protein
LASSIFVFIHGIIIAMLINVIKATEALHIEVIVVLIIIVIVRGEIRRGVGSTGKLAGLPMERRGEAIVTRCRSPRPAATVATQQGREHGRVLRG